MVHQSRRYPERIFVYVARNFDKHDASVTILKNGNFSSSGPMIEDEVHGYLTSLLKNIGHANCQIIGDGISRKLISQILISSNNLNFRTIICISFQGFRINSFMRGQRRLGEFVMPTFTYDEMLMAAVNGALPYSDTVIAELSQFETRFSSQAPSSDNEEQMSNSATFEDKFYYFGGCMRFHCLSSKESMGAISRSISEVEELSDDIILPNVRCSSASNTLVAVEVNDNNSVITGTSFLSKYIMKRIVDNYCSKNDVSDFIHKARRTLLTNPVFQGWVTELELISIFRNSIKNGGEVVMASASFPDIKIIFNVKNITYFERNNFPTNLQAGTLLIPDTWNYPTYDIAFVESDAKIIFLQVTNSSSSHTYNVRVLYNDAKQILPNCEIVEYCIVHSSKPKFSVPSIDNNKIQQEWRRLFIAPRTRSTSGKDNDVHMITLSINRLMF